MARYDYRDVVLELVELCREQKTEILQQLTYYRASVYKTETAQQIERKVEQMRLVCSLIGHAELSDAFQDYNVMRTHGHQWIVPGECPMSARVMNLVQSTEKIFETLANELPSRSLHDPLSFQKTLQKHRKDLLAMCRHGSRQWSFFNTL
jgi:hypothetical protein